MKIVVISDTHNLHNKITVPDGDLLIHCGDFSGRGSVKEVTTFNSFLGTLPHAKKIVIPGNHDFLFESNPGLAKTLLSNAVVLIDEEVCINGVRIFGSPWTPEFGDWAFMKSRSSLMYFWDRLPENIDILVTHGPPHGILDTISNYDRAERVGCQFLGHKVKKMKPKYHLFGHIHEGYGKTEIDGITYVNASICDERYRPVNPAITIEIE